jgi:hypothetical protein
MQNSMLAIRWQR